MLGIYIAAQRGRDPGDPSLGRFRQRLEINRRGYANTVTSVGKDNCVFLVYE